MSRRWWALWIAGVVLNVIAFALGAMGTALAVASLWSGHVK